MGNSTEASYVSQKQIYPCPKNVCVKLEEVSLAVSMLSVSKAFWLNTLSAKKKKSEKVTESFGGPPAVGF